MNGQRLKNNCWFAYFAALFIWSLLDYLEIGHLFFQGKIFAFYDHGRPYISDFINHFNAGILAKASIVYGINIYDPVIQNEFVKKLVFPVVPELPFYFQYPPFVFVLLMPLSSLSITTAWMVWDLLALVVILFCCYFLSKEYALSKFSKLFLFLAVLASFPTWLTFKLGQTSWLLLIGLFLFWTLAKKQQFFKAGLSTAFLMIKLQYLPIILMAGLIIGFVEKKIDGAGRFLAGVITSGGLLFVISLWKLGWKNIAAYPTALINNESTHLQSGVQVSAMQNFRGELSLFFGDNSNIGGIASILVFVIAAFMIAYIWIRKYPNLKANFPYAFELCASITTFVILITSLHTHIQDYLITMLPCVWLWICLHNPQFTIGLRQKKYTSMLIVLFPALSWVFYQFDDVLRMMYIQPYFLWALLLTMNSFSLLNKQDRLSIQ